MADEWPEEPQSGAWTPSLREQYPVPTVTPSTAPLPPPAAEPVTTGQVPIGRGAALVSTGALGVPGDIISTTLEPAINWTANRLGIPNQGNWGPQIPVPTTAYIRDRFGVAPPEGRAERMLDLTGKTAGSMATSAVLPGNRAINMLSGGAGTIASGYAQEFAPDSVALQLLAGGVAGLGTTAAARRLILGATGLPHMMGVGSALVRDYVGRAVGSGLAHITGLPEILTTEIGGLAGLLSHNAGRNLLTGPGMVGTVAGTAGAIPEAVQTQRRAETWPDEPQSNALVNP